MKRSSGMIMHISSLPEDYGIGTLGEEAYKFADFLNKAGQTYWQILPLGHTSYGDSPYQAFSAFAGNPYFIDLKFLVRDGLLAAEDLEGMVWGQHDEEVDYATLFNVRYPVLRKAYENAKGKVDEAVQAFAIENKVWLKDYAMYMAIKEKMNLVSWQEWDEDIKLREEVAMARYETELADDIHFWEFIQYEFYKQWNALKAYVNGLGMQIVGDIPIYVASDSSDAWANSKVFKLDADKKPTVVAGCPPDAFSATGQLWGNPIYDWDYLEETGYTWWITRMRESLKLYDIIRIDHFRGFEAFWEIPYGEETAVNGQWVKGPSIKLFDAIKGALGAINVVAEDLGFLTQEVFDFRDATGYPGMKVLQFAFDAREESDYIPHTYHKHCIVYTGTHDNDTIRGWMETTGNKEDVAHAMNYLKLNEEEGYNWGFIRGAWSSVGEVAITMMQDVLNLGNEARMNMPSTLGGNWMWRMRKEDLTETLAEKLYSITKLYGRCK
ncbi:MAG: 4-alpha-glucanotransferase [Cellulosilyticaceae bacterium]